MEQRTIKTLTTKIVSTKFGEKEKWLITFKESPNRIVDSFKGNWNSDWAVNDTISFSENQIKEREYQGKMYYTLQAPPEARFGGGVSRDEFDALVARVGMLESGALREEEEEEEEEEVPGESDEDIVKKIPF